MNPYFVAIYGVCFAAIGGAAFAMMWGNIKTLNEEMSKPLRPRHPEAPEPGEEVLFVDLEREKLEQLFDG